MRSQSSLRGDMSESSPRSPGIASLQAWVQNEFNGKETVVETLGVGNRPVEKAGLSHLGQG